MDRIAKAAQGAWSFILGAVDVAYRLAMAAFLIGLASLLSWFGFSALWSLIF